LAHAASLRRSFYFARLKFTGFLHTFIFQFPITRLTKELSRAVASSSGLNRLLHSRFRVDGKAFLQQPSIRIGQSRKYVGSRKREQTGPNCLVGIEFNGESLFTAFAMDRVP
jgi:integrase